MSGHIFSLSFSPYLAGVGYIIKVRARLDVTWIHSGLTSSKYFEQSFIQKKKIICSI